MTDLLRTCARLREITAAFLTAGPQTSRLPIQRFGRDYAGRLLREVIRPGWLAPEAVKWICDFGSGTGSPAEALLEIFRLPASALTLLEENPQQAGLLRRLLPTCGIIEADGVRWLKETNARFDLITAFMLGPEYEPTGFAESLILHAMARLSSQGALLICSDLATMHVVNDLLEGRNDLSCHWLIPDEERLLPVTVLIRPSPPQGESPSAIPELPPAPLTRAMLPDASGIPEEEIYSLSTAFERVYLQATIETFEAMTPEHPAISAMKALLG